MTLARPIRLALVVIATVLSGAMPALLMGSSHKVPQNQPPQAAPAKPSADVSRPSSLPATLPTEDPSPAVASPAEHFEVEYTDGKIKVNATNASLNKLLHEVAEKAGIKITGGVSDERVFGEYGPAKPSVVLASLLDGTGTNMLLVDDAKGGSELVLTQRSGGVTPPNPVASALETTSDQDGRPTSRYVSPIRPFQPPAPGRGPLAQPPNFGPPQSQTVAPGGAIQGDPSQSSGDNRTPQQIYEQLQENQKPQ